MAYLEQLLGRGEHMVFTTRPHLLVLISRVLTSVALVAVLVNAGLVARIAFGEGPIVQPIGLPAADVLLLLTMLVSLLVFIGLINSFLQWYSCQYAITDRRVLHTRGIWQKHNSETPLERINDVAITQTWVGRLANYGTVHILADRQQYCCQLDDIPRPIAFKRTLAEVKYQQEQGYGYLDERVWVDLEPTALQQRLIDFEVHRAIDDLTRLRDRGILSLEEYERKKQELLARA